ncbi:MAG: hypothetical protein ABIQ55_12380 [Gemmatimonadaceae bacterium]
MKYSIASAALLMLSAATLSAQKGDPDKLIANGGVSVPGWTGRLDPRPESQGRKITEAKFYPMGKGIHAKAGPAAIYWNPKNIAPASYTVAATFIQGSASAHPEGYGLIVGGTQLTTPNQSYLYFLVRQDGKFLINHRANDSTVHKIHDWTANSAVKAIDASGKATNTLSVVVDAKSATFRVNGTVVHTSDRAMIAGGGVAGIRVNHNLDVHIDGFGIAPAK